MQCPKCSAMMDEVECNGVVVDRCVDCGGMWFDKGESETLSEQWIAEFVDTGDPEVGEEMDDVDIVDCPRCSKQMRRVLDLEGAHIQFEECDEHGKFFDAGEFTLWAENQYL